MENNHESGFIRDPIGRVFRKQGAQVCPLAFILVDLDAQERVFSFRQLRGFVCRNGFPFGLSLSVIPFLSYKSFRGTLGFGVGGRWWALVDRTLVKGQSRDSDRLGSFCAADFNDSRF